MWFDAYRGRRVLVTGHTGFKGSWLAEWLSTLGAEVTGYALHPPTEPALFHQLGLSARLARHATGDVRDLSTLTQVVKETRPDFVFHLAAQPLVRYSYAAPVETYTTNVIGTVNVLEAVKVLGRPCSVVVATSDKCYDNQEQGRLHREDEPLGGHDPYSSSKACAEHVVSAYRHSFFSSEKAGIAVASARAGNVLGGGDWAADRIFPDCVRSLRIGEPIRVRSPRAIRPWQHVLEPLAGYLALGVRLSEDGPKVAQAYNFGPEEASHRTVAELVETLLKTWPGRWEDHSRADALHEAQRLHLSIDKAKRDLGWRPTWGFDKTVSETAAWYRAFGDVTAEAVKEEMQIEVAAYCRAQIESYTDAARRVGAAWAKTSSELSSFRREEEDRLA